MGVGLGIGVIVGGSSVRVGGAGVGSGVNVADGGGGGSGMVGADVGSIKTDIKSPFTSNVPANIPRTRNAESRTIIHLLCDIFTWHPVKFYIRYLDSAPILTLS